MVSGLYMKKKKNERLHWVLSGVVLLDSRGAAATEGRGGDCFWALRDFVAYKAYVLRLGLLPYYASGVKPMVLAHNFISGVGVHFKHRSAG